MIIILILLLLIIIIILTIIIIMIMIIIIIVTVRYHEPGADRNWKSQTMRTVAFELNGHVRKLVVLSVFMIYPMRAHR